MFRSVIVVVLLNLVVGCTTFETVKPDSVEGVEILKFEAPADGAALYVYRDRGSHFGGFEMILDVNEVEISLAPSCFKRVELSPGSYHLNANHPDLLGSEQELDLVVAVGDVRVLEFKPISRFAIPGESKLIPKTVEEARAAISAQALCMQSTSRI